MNSRRSNQGFMLLSVPYIPILGAIDDVVEELLAAASLATRLIPGLARRVRRERAAFRIFLLNLCARQPVNSELMPEKTRNSMDAQHMNESYSWRSALIQLELAEE